MTLNIHYFDRFREGNRLEVKRALLARDGKIWLNQQQMADLFATSKQSISHHVANILKDKELSENSVVKQFLTTAADGKNYNVVFYSLEMIIAVGYRVRGVRGKYVSQHTRSGACALSKQEH